MSGTARTRNQSAIPGTRVFRFGDVRFWTEKGVIVMANEALDEEKVLAPIEAKIRAASFYREGLRMLQRPGPGGAGGRHYRDEAQDMLKLSRALMECYVEAKKFGDPFDPEVAAREVEINREIKIHLNQDPRPKIIQPGDQDYAMPARPLTSFLGKA